MIDVPTAGLIVAAVLLLALAGLLTAAETAMSFLPRSDASEIIASHRRGSKALESTLEDLPSHVNVSTFVRICSEAAVGVCITLVVAEFLPRWWLVIIIAVASAAVLSFILVTVSPRTVGRRHAAATARLTAPFLHGLRVLLGPVASLLVWFGNALTPARRYRQGPFVTSEELQDLVDRAGDTDELEEGERDMIQSVFKLGDTMVKSVMVPRTDLQCLARDTTLTKAMDRFLLTGFSRAPVIGASEDDVRGVVYLKDVARRMQADPLSGTETTVLQIAREAVFVPETKPIDDLLRQMQLESTHVAIVIDEYGGTAGLVTIEDILEEIVGEIDDEYDRSTVEVEDLPDGVKRVSTRLPVEDAGELFGIDIDDDEVTSVGGLLSKALGQVPVPGASAEIHGLRLEAERGVGRRHTISTLLVSKAPPEPGDEEAEEKEHE